MGTAENSRSNYLVDALGGPVTFDSLGVGIVNTNLNSRHVPAGAGLQTAQTKAQ